MLPTTVEKSEAGDEMATTHMTDLLLTNVSSVVSYPFVEEESDHLSSASDEENDKLGEIKSTSTVGSAVTLSSVAKLRPTKTLSRKDFMQSLVIDTFTSKARECESNSYPVAAAVIHAMVKIVEMSTATTYVQLQHELSQARLFLFAHCVQHYNEISMQSVAELFIRFVSKTCAHKKKHKQLDFKSLRLEVIKSGKRFGRYVMNCRQIISRGLERFIRDGCVIMTHSSSSVVLRALTDAATISGRRFSVVVTETRPLKSGYKMARELSKVSGIVSVKVIMDSAVATYMSKVDFVLVGAEGVVESGGIINRIGSRQMAIIAKAIGRPFYVAAESCKFSRVYPLTEADIEQTTKAAPRDPSESPSKRRKLLDDSILRDYTPPEYITLLMTDLGILTPSAVSDELMNLYKG